MAEIEAAGGEAIGVICDVLDKDSLVEARQSIVEHYGTIDILINGAGGATAKMQPQARNYPF